MVAGAGRDAVVQVGHDAVLPQERATGRAEARYADDLPLLVDAQRLALEVAGKRAEIADAVVLRPQERVRVEMTGGRGVRHVREPHHVAALVHRHRRVPRDAAEAAQVGRYAVLPHDRVGGGEPAYRVRADARDADDLTAVVDRRGRAGRVAAERRELLDLVALGPPDHRAELEHLGRIAR